MAGQLGELALGDRGKPDDDVAVVVLRRIHSRNGNGAATGPTPAPGKSMTAVLEPGLGSPAEARAALSPLADAVPPLLYMDLCLLVSELVTNSVRHARLRPGDLIRLRVEVSDLMLRVEVSDPGEGFVAEIPEPTASGPGGWGLFLTERLAHRWGVDRDGEWTTVWLEVDIDRRGRTSG
jgi:anti-sigma regulatory factor (Ser/Thr protein kinase)